MTKLLTIEEAIAARLEEKRRAREEKKRRELATEAIIKRREGVAVTLFREWLAKKYNLDLNGYKVVGHNSDSHSSNCLVFVVIELDNGTIHLQNHIALTRPDGHNWENEGQVIATVVEFTTGYVWRAYYKGQGYVQFDNLIDALAYIKYGTSDPENMKDDEIEIPF